MRTIGPSIIVIAIGVAAIMWAGSGLGAVFQDNPADGLSSGDRINNSSQDAPGASDFGGDAGNSGDGDIIGLIISGIGFITDYVAFVVLLPFELANLGFPFWFAAPVGATCQLIAGIGLIQFATGRQWI